MTAESGCGLQTGLLLDPRAASQIELWGTVPAAVLVALYSDGEHLRTVLTERRADLSRHAGEISFPGGRRDPDDLDLIATALRETEEEIGLAADEVDVIGALAPTPTLVTGYAIYPFVGLIAPGHCWTPSPGEVSAVLEPSLEQLQHGYARQRIVRHGMPVWTDTYTVDGHTVWGATARILADLLARVTPRRTHGSHR